MLTGRFLEADSFFDQALKAPGEHFLVALAARHELLFASGRVLEAARLAHAIAEDCSRRGLDRLVSNWRSPTCVDLLYAGENPDSVAQIYPLLPQKADLTGFIRLVLMHLARLPE